MNIPHPVMTSDLLERYLNLLGVQRRKPSTDALYELVQAQLVKVPFEMYPSCIIKSITTIKAYPILNSFWMALSAFISAARVIPITTIFINF
jgi:hypothetical protein